jgi:hypothetical protein
MIVTEFLDLAAMLVPERTAIVFEGKRYSYAQLKERVNRLADSLSRLGLEKGASANEARIRIHSWLSDYGQDMLVRKRVAQNNDSLLIPSCRYLDPQWLAFFDIKAMEKGWRQLQGSP